MRLLEFDWDGDRFDFAPLIRIQRFEESPDLSAFEPNLSSQELDKSNQVTHWLCVTWDEQSQPFPNAIGELFLLSLWIIKPTKTHIDFRFWTADDGRRFGSSRLLDRFSWIPETAGNEYNTDELEQASRLYQVLVEIYLRRGRLNDCILLSVSGCWAHFWQAALICHAAAIEAILTYSTAPGITRRLAVAYACVTEVDHGARDAAYAGFLHLYGARSDIMHGRTFQIAEDERLRILDRFQTVVRRLLFRLCSDAAVRTILEDNDEVRREYFERLQAGYNAPRVN